MNTEKNGILQWLNYNGYHGAKRKEVIKQYIETVLNQTDLSFSKQCKLISENFGEFKKWFKQNFKHGANSELTFADVTPPEFALMNADQIIELIKNTFPSKVISRTDKLIIIESDFHLLCEPPLVIFLQDDVNTIKKKIYFHIYFTNDFVIVRSHTAESIAEFVANVVSKHPDVTDDKHGNYANGDRFSTILKGRMFPNMLYSTRPIPYGKEFVDDEDGFHSLNSMGCGVDTTLIDTVGVKFSNDFEIKKLNYYSDLLVGGHISFKQKQNERTKQNHG